LLRALRVRIGSGFGDLAGLVVRPRREPAGADAVFVTAASVVPSPSAALRASAAFRSAFVYWFQCVLHIRPRPSFWLGWTGKSSIGASCASIPNFADPMHLRISAMSVVLSLVNADLALRRTSITPVARRCKAEDRAPPDDQDERRRRPDDGVA
jgi:hypothetical protein